MRNVLVVACASALGIVWGCTSFDAAVDGTGSPDATTGDTGPDATGSDAAADATTTVVDDAQVVDDARAGRGPQCTGTGTFCTAGQLCCFRISGAADGCVMSAADCKGDAGTGAFVLACSDSASCPASMPNCCFTFGDGQGSACQMGPCGNAIQLCAVEADCMAPQHCMSSDSGLDNFYGECH